jgi:hypothetical protein
MAPKKAPAKAQAQSVAATGSKPVCKESGCYQAPTNKGFCRKHFLSVLSGKAQGDAKPKGDLHLAPAQRRVKRLRELEGALFENAELDEETRTGLSKVDLELEGLELDDDLLKKVG